METTTQQNPVSNPAKESVIDQLKNFAAQPTPGTGQQMPGTGDGNPAGATLSDKDFLNTGSHTQNSNPVSPATPGTPAIAPVMPAKGILTGSGKLAVSIVHEMILPALIVWVCTRAGRQIDRDGLKLSKDEKELLTSGWDAYLNSVNVNIDKPIYQLLIAIGIVYGTKFMDGSIKITTKKISVAEQITTVPDKVTKDNFRHVYDLEREQLIKITNRTKKSRKVAIEWLERTGAFKKLETELRKKHNIPANV